MTSTTPAARALSDSEFHQLAHAVLARVEAMVDRWLDDDVVDIDSQRTGGLLELSLPGGSKRAMYSIHTGRARPPPVSRSPSLRGLS
jgi:hypothetical protein